MSSITPAVEFTPSLYQQDFFNWVRDGRGSCVLVAVAGSGKTTSVIESLRFTKPGLSIKLLAFNTIIAKELNERLTSRGYNPRDVSAATFHSLCFGAVRKHLEGRGIRVGKPDSNKLRTLLIQMLGKESSDYATYSDYAAKLVGLARGEGIGVLIPDTFAAWSALASHHDLQLETDDATEEHGIEIARVLLASSNHAASSLGIIDFDDMLYCVLLWKLRLWQNDWVFIDEAQDTNPVRRAIAKLVLRPGGRLVAVGDPRQAIYGFCHPPGTMIMTPNGESPIETLCTGDSVIISDAGGSVSGWQNGAKIIECQKYYHSGNLLTVTTDGARSVEFTPHHRIPVKIDLMAKYYTYMMCRNGTFRVGSCKAYTNSGDFMFTHRYLTEKAEQGWLLATHPDKTSARMAEDRLLCRVKGITFQDKTDNDLAVMEDDSPEAFKILAEHGRMFDFPLLHRKSSHRVARNGAIVIEACNLMDGMRVAFYDDTQINSRKRGRGKQDFVWTPCSVTARPYTGFVYGITVPSVPIRDSYQKWNLYFGGPGKILVHNTGASHDAIDLIKAEFNAIELPLTVSYRCARSVVELAQTVVSHIEAAPGAVEGSVTTRPLAEAVTLLTPQDAVLCRQTAPLIKLAFSLIARGTGCQVLGRDIGAGLTSLVKRAKAKGIDALIVKLDAWRDREVAKHTAKGEELKAETVTDKVECVMTVINSLDENNRTIPALLAAIDWLFNDAGGCLTLSTIHKAKGREWSTVAILRPDLMPSKWARQDWQADQEQNIIYVAYTRAKTNLIFIEGEK